MVFIFPALFAFIPQLIASIGTAASSIGTGVGTAVGTGLSAAGLGSTGTAIGTGLGSALAAPGGMVGGIGSALGGGGGLTASGGLLSESVGGGLPGSVSLPEVLASPSAEMMGLNQGVVFAEGAQVAPGMAPVPATVGSEVGTLPTAVLGGAPQGGAGAGFGELAKQLKSGQMLMNQNQQQQQQPPPAMPQPQPRPTAPQPSNVQPPVGMEQLMLRMLMQRLGQSPGGGIAGAL